MNKINFKNVPIDITMSEYMALGTLYASWQAMTSENKHYYFICLSDKKVYMFDSVLEHEQIKQHAENKDFALINVLNN